MPAFSLTHATQEQGFRVVHLSSAAVEISVVPDLGAKIISLRNRISGREWLWHPPGPLRLFGSPAGADFSTSALTGTDECLPTIAACQIGKLNLPDHGEVWSRAWHVHEEGLARGIIRTSVLLNVAPLLLVRTLTLHDSLVRIDYELENQSSFPVPYLWALHPLLAPMPEDRLELPGAVTEVYVESARPPDVAKGTRWSYPQPRSGMDLSRLHLSETDGAYAKFFAGPLPLGNAAIHNDRTGDRLEFSWETPVNPYVGIWITRGGWNGHHHFAIEPTNAPADSLAAAAGHFPATTRLAARERRTWRITLALSQKTAASGTRTA